MDFGSFPIEVFESLLRGRPVVSFDVFDTLLVRKVRNPTDAFALLESATGVSEFQKSRIEAEKQARKHNLYRRCKEVTIEDIYVASSWDMGTRTRLLEEEIKLEKELNVANPLGQYLYRCAREAGCTIVATSDMYLPRAMIQQILHDNGFHPEKVFVSSDYKLAKGDGSLFEKILENSGPQKRSVIHIGDNYISDHQAPCEKGILGLHLPTIYDMLLRDTRFNTLALQELDVLSRENFLASFVMSYLARWRTEKVVLNISSLFGAMYAGVVNVCFSIWLDTRARARGIDKLLCMSRDGIIIDATIRKLKLETQSEVIWVSRRMLLVAAFFEDTEFATRCLFDGEHLTVKEGLIRLSLEHEDAIIEHFERHDLAEMTVRQAGLQAIEQACIDCDAFRMAIMKEKQDVKSYLRTMGIGTQEIALVDSGWGLSSHRLIEKLFDEKLDIAGFYFGAHEQAFDNGQIECFLFKGANNQDELSIFETSPELLELLFASPDAQCRTIKETKEGFSVNLYVKQTLERIRALNASTIKIETLKFVDEIKDWVGHIRVEDGTQVLHALLMNLMTHPTDYEFHNLRTIPHNRHVGNSRFEKIGDYWQIQQTRGLNDLERQNHNSPKYPIVHLLVSFISLWKSFGARVAIQKASRFLVEKVHQKQY